MAFNLNIVNAANTNTTVNMNNTNASLYRSGKYSDLTLLCEGKTFKVHRYVVCPRSKTIEAACDGKFMESSCGTLEVTVGTAATLELMLNFIYLGKYSVFEEQGNDDKQIDDECSDSVAAPAEMNPNDAILTHLHVIIMADYYDVQDLIRYASNNIWLVLDSSHPTTRDCKYKTWSLQGFGPVIKTIFCDVPEGMQAVRTYIEHVIEKEVDAILSDNVLMSELSMIPDFMMALIRPMQDQLRAVDLECYNLRQQRDASLRAEARWRNKAKSLEVRLKYITKEKKILERTIVDKNTEIKD